MCFHADYKYEPDVKDAICNYFIDIQRFILKFTVPSDMRLNILTSGSFMRLIILVPFWFSFIVLLPEQKHWPMNS